LALFKKNPADKKSTIHKRFKINPAKVWSVCLVLLILAALSISLVRIYQEVKEQKKYELAKETVEEFPASHIEGLISQQPDAMVSSNEIDIHGEAADSIIVSLKVNGKLIAVALPQNGVFEFSEVKLGYGANEIVIYGMDTNGNAAILQKIETTYGSPRLAFLARDVTRGPSDRKEVALTFDGGSGNGATDAILNILRDKDIQCSMFLTGGFLKRYPEQVKQMLKDGHEIGNHTWSHPHLTSFAENKKHDTLDDITREKLQNELITTASLFKKTTNQKMKPYWRAPFGEHNHEIRLWAGEVGYRQIGWTHGRGETMDSMDWVADTTSAVYKSSDEILQKLLAFGEKSQNGANGSIILMHLDTQRQTEPVHEIIPAFVDSMRTRGYEFVTVTELLRP
jgi:peptidoglycan/xylan/chitin deacetylase (PgdA/CDA1 family)